jgi:predicted adenylyl cyclase CyaB
MVAAIRAFQMKVRRASDLKLRPEQFGGVLYVPTRDDFFAIDSGGFRFVNGLSAQNWASVDPSVSSAVTALAQLQIVETIEPHTKSVAYSGPSFIGHFKDIATLENPLVLNCFSTAHCPLKCVYCHADDLMGSDRRQLEDGDVLGLDNVLAVARRVPSLVAVVTGGDPLTRPERAKRLISELSADKALVLDTSGVASPEAIRNFIPTLVEHRVHVRISLDFAIPQLQERMRPVNRVYAEGLSSYYSPLLMISECLQHGVPVTVQSVVSRKNDTAASLIVLRDFLIERGVRHWVLHLAVEAGLARKIEAQRRRGGTRARGILPNPDAPSAVWKVVKATIADRLPIDIRVTDNANTPNSVLLLGADGVLYTEGLAHRGKVELFNPEGGNPQEIEKLFYYIDKFGHARRYLNWNPHMFDGADLADCCVSAHFPVDCRAVDIVERERKYRLADKSALERYLRNQGFRKTGDHVIDDRYYDTEARELKPNDFVIRVRIIDRRWRIAMKGPRFRKRSGEYDRIELEFDALDSRAVERQLLKKGLEITWRLERRRKTFSKPDLGAEVVIDEMPVIGDCMEIEGDSNTISAIASEAPGLGAQETRNYQELIEAWCGEKGVDFGEVYGLGTRGLLKRRRRP